MYLSVCVFLHMYSGALGVKKRMSESLDSELQAAMTIQEGRLELKSVLYKRTMCS